MKWFMHCLRNYTTFTGRASRAEYWWFYLVVAVVGLGLNFLGSWLDSQALELIWGLGTLPPTLAVASRRMHDTGHSFWWYSGFLAAWIPFAVFAVMYEGTATPIDLYALALVPYAAYLIYLLCKPGDSGPNRYGAPAPTAPA